MTPNPSFGPKVSTAIRTRLPFYVYRRHTQLQQHFLVLIVRFESSIITADGFSARPAASRNLAQWSSTIASLTPPRIQRPCLLVNRFPKRRLSWGIMRQDAPVRTNQRSPLNTSVETMFSRLVPLPSSGLDRELQTNTHHLLRHSDMLLYSYLDLRTSKVHNRL